jgi:hypothetical protein
MATNKQATNNTFGYTLESSTQPHSQWHHLRDQIQSSWTPLSGGMPSSFSIFASVREKTLRNSVVSSWSSLSRMYVQCSVVERVQFACDAATAFVVIAAASI